MNPASNPGSMPSRLTGASVTILTLAWLLWVLLMGSYALDFLIAWFQDAKAGKSAAVPMDAYMTYMLAVMAVGGLIFAGVARWFFFHFLIQPKRSPSGTWTAAIMAMLGIFIIYAMIKAVETYGVMIWFGSRSWPHYLGFAVPSAILMFFHMPALVMTRRVMHRRVEID
ncbi:MAG TPA: hypothetical protein VK956_17610 [Verrucomicrobium sp.]|nr:hypothetical protein [Verrucomicrobium sp.]